MALYHSPRIITDGLVLCLDAANKQSYPGSGDIWTDLAGSNNGTLINGVGFNAANVGSLVFDGANDVVTFSSNNIISGTQNFTVEVIVKSNDTISADYIFGNYGLANPGGIEIYFYLQKLGMYFGGVYLIGSLTVSSNTWYIATFTRNGNTTSLYINGILDATGTNSNSITTNLSYSIGNGLDYAGEIYPGNIAKVSVYNRALTPTEILQNYNATKGRYNL